MAPQVGLELEAIRRRERSGSLLPKSRAESRDLKLKKKNGSSGRTRTYNPPVNRLVGRSTNKLLAVQMTTHENTETREITDSVTLG
jgi:hypothetical protein